MKQQSLSVLFYLNKAKTNQQGRCSIYCRITYLKQRKQFSTGNYVFPTDWNAKKQKLRSSKINDVINGELLLISQKINKVFLNLKLNESEFGVQDILEKYFEKTKKMEGHLIRYFTRFQEKRKKLIGKDLTHSTWQKFEYVKMQAQDFIKSKYKTSDYPLSKLNNQFLVDFEYYLKTERNQKQVTTNKAIQRLRKPVTVAVAEGYLDKDPFILYKPRKVIKEVVFLSPAELKQIELAEFSQPRLNFVRQLFVFSCYTGLAYNELFRLRRQNIVLGFDKGLWIQMKREKTSKPISVPLLPIALKIIEKYSGHNNLIFPRISNQKYNSYLKEIAAVLGIEKKLTTHTARKTFASTVLLYNDVPMEIVSELLGHSSLKVTQDSYAKVVQRKVSEAIKVLEVKLVEDTENRKL
ncbi:tyrosine-type recombinase/integrase [Formosa sp. S-31]|uniref:site-specific integrase n=1 Tax=Formosa sp. S-31 TaxID=2790949 RepID=UPI003EC111F6